MRQIDFFSTFSPPVYISEIHGITSAATGKEVMGWFLAGPCTIRRMLVLPERMVFCKMIEVGHLAERHGSRILSLVAFSSVVGAAGLTISLSFRIPVTTGDSNTIANAVEEIPEVARPMEIPLRAAMAAVVGATGEIGRVCAEMLADDIFRLVLIGRNPGVLHALQARLAGSGRARVKISTSIESRSNAQLILTVTSAVHEIIHPELLQQGSVIWDVARPRDVSAMVATTRNDIFVIDGGMVGVPGSVDLYFKYFFHEERHLPAWPRPSCSQWPVVSKEIRLDKISRENRWKRAPGLHRSTDSNRADFIPSNLT